MRSVASILTAPILCLGMLGAVAADNWRHVNAGVAEPFHARAKVAIQAMPYVVGYWTGSDTRIPDSAVELLRPNTYLGRRYVENRTDGPWRGDRVADLLVVQCRDTRDMTGHYPPICYPSSGETLVDRRRFTLPVAGTSVTGTEYLFTRPDGGSVRTRSVYDFFIVPGRGVVADIQGVRKAAGDYQRRYFGAAQFQVVMSADLPQDERDAIFTTLIGANPRVFHDLNDLDLVARP